MPDRRRSENRDASPSDGSSRWGLARIGLFLAGLAALAYHRVLFLGETWVERDALRFVLPSRQFLASSLRSLRLPEWFDGVGFGAPFAANPVHEVFAPLGWTLALAPGLAGFDLYELLHLVIGGLGVAALARRFGAERSAAAVAAGALMLGGWMTSMIPNGWGPELAWIPWVVCAADRVAVRTAAAPGGSPLGRAILVFAAALALQVLAGEPAALLLALALSVTLLFVRHSRLLRGLSALATGAVGSLLLAAVAVVPGVILLGTSARGAGLDAGGIDWSLAPARLGELAWPALFGVQTGDAWVAGAVLRGEGGDPYWSMSLFLGLPVLLAAVAGLADSRVRRMMLASLGFVLLALGPAGLVEPVLRRLLSPLSWVNFPAKYFHGALVLWTVAAALGLTRILRSGVPPWLRWTARIATGVLIAAVGIGTVARTTWSAALTRQVEALDVLLRPQAAVRAALVGGWLAAAAALAFMLFLELRGGRRRRLSLALLGVAFLGPGFWVAGVTTPFASRGIVTATPRLLEPLVTDRGRPDAPRPRVFRADPPRPAGPFSNGADVARHYHATLETNLGSSFGVAIVPGFEPGESERSRRLGTEVFPSMDKLAFLRLTGIEWLVAQDPEALGLPVRIRVRGSDGWALVSPGAVRPRAFVTPRVTWIPEADEALDRLGRRTVRDDPTRVEVVGPGTSPSLYGSGPGAAPCEVRSPRPELVRLICPPEVRGVVVLLDEKAPGWTAEVDGPPAEVLLADGLFRAVSVPAGAREIVFRYRTPGLRKGALVSALAWALWGFAMLRGRPSSRRAS